MDETREQRQIRHLIERNQTQQAIIERLSAKLGHAEYEAARLKQCLHSARQAWTELHARAQGVAS